MDTADKILLVIIGVGLTVGIVVALALRSTSSQSSAYKVVHTYDNLEEWTFLKDDDGRVRGVRVTRKAKQD